MNTPIGVGQLVGQIKDLLEQSARLHDVLLQGEISNFVRATSGHCYFTLKDERGKLDCVLWRRDALLLPRLPQNGQQVILHGYVSLYEPQGKLQFYADWVQEAGIGRLYEQFERLKAQLAAEGLFDPATKRPLPPWPQRIGVITSPRAAALRDVLRTLAARFPAVEVLLAPAAVQGAEAPPQIVAAIELLNAWHLGVEPLALIVLARGGGSIEELWAFNDERVARAVAASVLPVISGVGHETDFTLADFAADVRAPTPTGAATLATPDRSELLAQLAVQRQRLGLAVQGQLVAERRRLEHSRRLLGRLSPRARIAAQRQQTDDLAALMQRQMGYTLRLRRARLNGLYARLANLDPRAVLQRGYAIVYRAADGRLVTAAQQVAVGDRLRIVLAEGELQAVASAPSPLPPA
ncbi:MAG: exodeoxyribonuclease VII large subunit [Caldilineales bacterium]